MMQDPDNSSRWLGFYEMGTANGSALNLAYAPS